MKKKQKKCRKNLVVSKKVLTFALAFKELRFRSSTE